jgi:L-rhamnose mutarotase
MLRQVLAIDLKDDSVVEAYREHHRRVWPEVLNSLRASGLIEMQIYLLGRRLVMIAELEEAPICGRRSKHASPRIRASPSGSG